MIHTHRLLWLLIALAALTPCGLAADAPALRAEGYGFSVARLTEGGRAFENRDYVWKDVPEALRGLQCTRTAGGERASIAVRAAADVEVLAATAAAQGDKALDGWQKVEGLQFRYTDKGQTLMQVYRRAVKAGEPLVIPQGNWTGTLALAPRIEAVALPPAQANLTKVPGTVVFHSPAMAGLYVGSPGIAVLPDGAYLAKCDLFGPKSKEHESAISPVFRSEDKGQTWRQAARINGLFWANVFVHRGAAYLMGTDKNHGRIVIFRSDDGGRTWTQPKDAATGLLTEEDGHHTAPMPMVEHAGRLWRAFEDFRGGTKWGERYRAMMLSAPLDADLLRRDSWTLSNAVARDPAWLGGAFGGWLEGNAVLTPDGRIVDILRVDVKKNEKAAIVRLSPDGRTATFDPAADFVDFPGGAKKFTIRFDPATKRYWSLVNPVPPKYAEFPAAGVRNTLALTSSADLRTWTIHCLLLHHEDRLKHAFQYPDWVFDGDDLLAASRTAYDDGLGGAHNAHDANFLTFHRFRNFRRLSMADSCVDPRTLGLTP